ncbi:MAG: hypothetical protein QXR81_07765 [Candidatus Nezhaarchaeales archaeon]
MSKLLSELKEEEREALENLAKALAYFARGRAYGYIDRLANAFSVVTARQVVTEALRDLRSLRDRGEDAYLPKLKDVEAVLRLSESDLSVLKVVAALALSYG